LLSDDVKVQQARSLVMTIGAASLNPALLEVLHIAILTIWALAESILDVRALLKGKKVPFIKNEEMWTLALENITAIEQDFITAKESAGGYGYKDYVGILLLFEDELQQW
jgi:hypothetical protein